MDLIKEICKGLLIGIANILPGVSGGTLAISMGIYDQIIRAVTHVFQEPKKSMRILLPYGIGAGIGVVALSAAIECLFTDYPFVISMLFIGLISGGIPTVLRRVEWRKDSFKEYAVSFLVFSLMVLAARIGGNESRNIAWNEQEIGAAVLFCAGILAAATMVLPGVSGTMLLMMFGCYQPILMAINKFILCLMTLQIEGMIKEGMMLLPFGAGLAAGIFLFARLVEFLCAEHESLTYSAITGLVLSSPIVILWEIVPFGVGIVQFLMGIVLLLAAGIAAVVFSA